MVKTASLKSAEDSIKHPGKVRGPLPKQESKTQPTLYIFRHGESYYNRARLFCGRHNSRLTPRGKKQARLFCGRHNSRLTPRGKKQAQILGTKLRSKKIDLGLTPNLTRCTMTLNIVLAHFSARSGARTKVRYYGSKVEIDPRLLERDYGKLTSRSKIACSRRDPELCLKYRRSWDFPPPGGESIKDVWDKRIRPSKMFGTNESGRFVKIWKNECERKRSISPFPAPTIRCA